MFWYALHSLEYVLGLARFRAGLFCISIRIESALERHSKHDTINNCSYNSTLKCLHGTHMEFIDRSAKTLYDFVRLVVDFESPSKADSTRIDRHNSSQEFHRIEITL